MTEIVNLEVLKNKELYESLKGQVEHTIQLNIDNKNELVNIEVDGNTHEITLGNLLTFLICFRVFVEIDFPFTEEYLFNPSDTRNINNFFDLVIENTSDSLSTELFGDVKRSLMVTVSELARVSGDINLANGNTISIKTFIDLANAIPEFNDLIHAKLPDDNLQFNEIEDIMKNWLDRTIEILKSNETDVTTYLNSGSGINTKQFGQVVNIVGPKPDLDGNIIPYPINTSFLRGLGLPDFFINAKGARKALITNSSQVRNSGYLNRKLSMLCLDERVVTDTVCDTKHPMPVVIFDKNVLKRYEGRFFKNAEGNDELITLDRKDLIGETLEIYSPVTCACEEGICERCYGKLSRFNFDINIGIVAVLMLSEPLTQRLLSAKHLLATRSKKIAWGDNFEKFLTVNMDNVSYNDPSIKIVIDKNDLDEEEYSDVLSFSNFKVVCKDGTEHEISSPMELHLNNAIIDIDTYYNEEDNNYQISGLVDENIFYYVMDNMELSSALNALKDVLDKNEYIKSHTVQETLNKLIELIEDSGINIQAVHLEVILKCLIIIKGNRNQFNEETFPEYNMYRIKEAILRGNSVVKSLTFEELGKQLSTLEFDLFDKEGSSLLDSLI